MTVQSREASRPLRERKLDLVIVGWFAINLVFVVYTFDVEQIAIADPHDFTYPVWPPAPFVDAIHFWGHNYDPLLIARPSWFRTLIWLDIILFGPFYAAAIFAFVKARRWIRLPAVIWATAMLVHLAVILIEQVIGPYPAPNLPMTFAVYGSYVVLPLLVLWRVWPESFFAASPA